MTPELSDSGVPKSDSALLASYFLDASAKFKTWVLKPPGGTAASREFRQARAASLIAQSDVVLMGLKAKASGWVGKRMPQAFKEGIARGNTQAEEAGVRVQGSGFSGDFSLINQRSIVILARDAAADLYKAADSMGERTKTTLRQTAQAGLAESDIDKILAGGLIEGQPVETIRALREELKRVHGDQVEINGRNFEVGDYAEIVARTKTREASVQARHERLQELDLDLVAIIGRISVTFCTAFLGQVFSLGGKSTTYPAYSSLPGGGPPFHPRCSKSTRPFVEALAGKKQLAQAEILPDAARLLEMKPAAAQKAFTELQLHAQVKDRYATTAKKLFG